MGDNNITRDELMDLCKLRHQPIEKYFIKIDNKFTALFNKIWWIYGFIILSLGGIIANLYVNSQNNNEEKSIIINIDESIIKKK